MKINKQARRDGKALFRSCLVQGVIDDGRVRTAVAQVIAQKPRGYLAILHHFQRLLRLEAERRTARIESAAPLSDASRESIRANLTQRYGQGLTIGFEQNAALIGGVRVKVGSDVYDGSVVARLNAMEESF